MDSGDSGEFFLCNRHFLKEKADFNNNKFHEESKEPNQHKSQKAHNNDILTKVILEFMRVEESVRCFFWGGFLLIGVSGGSRPGHPGASLGPHQQSSQRLTQGQGTNCLPQVTGNPFIHSCFISDGLQVTKRSRREAV